MAQTCQHPGCDRRGTYPFIDTRNGTKKKYDLCEDHHREARNKTGAGDAPSGEDLSERVGMLFGQEFADATFSNYVTDREHFEALAEKMQAHFEKVEESLPQDETFGVEDHVGQLSSACNGLEAFTKEMAESGHGTVVLGGRQGVGKTHLAAACVRRLIRHGYEPAMWHATDMLNQIRATYNSSPARETRSVDALINRMTQSDVLVLEDIRPSCFANDMQDHIFNAVDRVYSNQGMIVITSNFTLKELSSPDRLGPYIVDRLCAPPSFIQDIQGISYRQVRKATQ